MNNKKEFITKIFQSSFFMRFCIVVFYFALLSLFLYSSKLKDFFFPDRTLRIYTFVNNFLPDSIKEFERLNGVRVVVRYFDSNEELFAKFKISRGVGYDLVSPSDYMVEALIKEDLLQKLDHTKLPVIRELDHRLIKLPFDPENAYSLPLMWVPYGIIFSKSIFRDVPDKISLSLLFENPKLYKGSMLESYKICMIDDCREALFFAYLYLFKEFKHFSSERLEKMKNVLINQKNWVESYSNQELKYYLLSGTVKVALAQLVHVKKLVEENGVFDFKIPEEGSLISIENLVIPKTSNHADLAHKFINFILSKEVAHKNSSFYGFNTTNRLSYEYIDKKSLDNKHFYPDDAMFKKMHLLGNAIPLKVFEDIWLTVKSA
jgi:spermidine/putrescine transport system substrate-binding protein